MVKDTALRQRKQDKKSSKLSSDGIEKPTGNSDATKTQKQLSIADALYPLLFVLLAFLVAGVLFAVQYPAVLKGSLNFLFGGFEDDSFLPLSNVNAVVDLSADIPKRDAVVEAFKHAWLAYERDAMGDDEYHPISRTGSNLTKAGGIGYTVADSMDTMLIMGLSEEYERARSWVANKLSFDKDADYHTFETTIRVLGGLLACYHLSGNDPVFLEKARDLGDRILPTFETEIGLPTPRVNLGQRIGILDKDQPGMVSTAEVATLQLELRYLAFLTDEDIYWEKAEKVMSIIRAARMPHNGLAPIFISAKDGRFVTSIIRLGSRGDSYYEYLLKQYLQTNLTEPVYREMYDEAMTAIHRHLVQKSMSQKLTYTAELLPERNKDGGQIGWRVSPKQDHLVCFLGGSLMLGATTTGALVHPVSVPPLASELSQQGKRDWTVGVELIKTCMVTHQTATGLSPEIVHFRMPSSNAPNTDKVLGDWYIKGSKPLGGSAPALDARYILRPETVESLFVAFRLTGDSQYREYGWQIFQSIEEHCKIPSGGYASILNVEELPVSYEDKMETFMMSETLKYLYLLFADASVLPLDQYVFNTEAHPLPVFNPTIRTGFS